MGLRSPALKRRAILETSLTGLHLIAAIIAEVICCAAEARRMTEQSNSEPLGPDANGFTPIGRVDAVCPHCAVNLPKKPARKTKCPACAQFIYVRTWPLDRQRVLLKETELDPLEAEWNRYHLHSTLSRLDKPGFSDEAQWVLCESELKLHAENADWGLYRNTRLHMGNLMHRQGRLREALVIYLEVSYLDINDPQNMGGISDSDLIREFPPFSGERGSFATGVLEWVREVAAQITPDEAEVEPLFMKMASAVQRKLRLPVSPQVAWRKLREETWSSIA